MEDRSAESKCAMQRSGVAVVFAALIWITTGFGGNALEAATITVLEDNGNVIYDFSSPNKLDIDVDWLSTQPVLLDVLLGPNDTDSTIFFSGFHLNLTGLPWSGFSVELEGGATWELGDTNDWQIIPGATGGLSSRSFSSTRAQMSFNPAIEPFDALVLGDAGGPIDPDLDWRIALNGLGSGDSFQIRLSAIPIPEPSSLALTATSALAGLGLLWNRRRRQAMTS
ncbi:PEP-CTERM sorting domain-containing protein [Tautonia rosea]|uniref:PEP-CTERM sorting domain-containing protein n=1 Tax=Tautonia rosea TaxID=2728037 RepID=UPI0014751F6C|nr:PEP-CTERM sorting domain-containing protein [Tautonia rosea]